MTQYRWTSSDSAFADEACPQTRPAYAAEHVLGVAAGVEPALLDGLRDAFSGGCTEAGLYLAMARAAEREGCIEAAAAFSHFAREEAERAALAAEILGERLSPSTETNLQRCVERARASCAAKTELAVLAKAHNLDALHDALHESARDEARHGRAFEGLLRRNFEK